ncbi:MAG: response regulator transcription factor [Armatimonadetes bacterium]|nr:response regulator [Armatimonadota bacterium]MBS1703173.1 response regulator transcription factor [Armatimonadota bacterium]MBS1727742.1 response regulator transcription factor [Armatimonadota bacterium]
MKLLIIEDDVEIASAIRDGLEDAGFVVQIVRDGERGLRVAQANKFSVIILDLMLPTMDGMTICRHLRETRNATPILMLSAKDTLRDRVGGLEQGADDYLGKPFQFEELLARIRALLRRDKVIKSAELRVDDLIIDTAARTVHRGGKEIVLTQREYTLLEALASREGQVLTRDTIQHVVWTDEFSTSNTVDVHVRNLRKKVDGDFTRKLIHTVVGAGYSLRVDSPEQSTP